CLVPSASVQWSAAVMTNRILPMVSGLLRAGLSSGAERLVQDVAVRSLLQAGELAIAHGPQVDEPDLDLRPALGSGVVVAVDEHVVLVVGVVLLGPGGERLEIRQEPAEEVAAD